MFKNFKKVNSKATEPLIFKWPNGQLINSTYWNMYQPNNNGGNSTFIGEGCVVILPGQRLNDVPCSVTRKLICQEY